MTDRTISLRQLMTVLFLALFPLGTEQLPGRLSAVGAAAWLCPILAGGIAVALVALLGRSPVLGQGDLGQRIAQRWGQRTGRVLAGLFLLWGLYLTAAHAARIGSRLSDSLRASPILITAVALLLAGWMASGGLPAFARAGQVFLAVLLTAAGAVLLLSLPQVRGEHLLTLWWGDALPVLRSTVPLLGVLGYGVFAAFLLGDTEPSPRRGRDWALWAGGGCLLLGAEQAVVIGNLGPELARRLNSPFFALAKSVGVEGAFQRVESIIAALWTFADLSLLGVLAFALWKAAKQVFPRAKQKPTVTAILIPGAVLGIAAFPEGVMADTFGRETALLGNLMMGLALPLLVLAVCWGREMFRHSPHFVYKSAQKTEDMVAEEQSEKKTEKTEKND